jgi:hypothetical protein
MHKWQLGTEKPTSQLKNLLISVYTISLNSGTGLLPTYKRNGVILHASTAFVLHFLNKI